MLKRLKIPESFTKCRRFRFREYSKQCFDEVSAIFGERAKRNTGVDVDDVDANDDADDDVDDDDDDDDEVRGENFKRLRRKLKDG